MVSILKRLRKSESGFCPDLPDQANHPAGITCIGENLSRSGEDTVKVPEFLHPEQPRWLFGPSVPWHSSAIRESSSKFQVKRPEQWYHAASHSPPGATPSTLTFWPSCPTRTSPICNSPEAIHAWRFTTKNGCSAVVRMIFPWTCRFRIGAVRWNSSSTCFHASSPLGSNS
jgi:hypothetical protein